MLHRLCSFPQSSSRLLLLHRAFVSNDLLFVLLHSIMSACMKQTIPAQLSGLEGALKKERDIIDDFEVKCLICFIFNQIITH